MFSKEYCSSYASHELNHITQRCSIRPAVTLAWLIVCFPTFPPHSADASQMFTTQGKLQYCYWLCSGAHFLAGMRVNQITPRASVATHPPRRHGACEPQPHTEAHNYNATSGYANSLKCDAPGAMLRMEEGVEAHGVGIRVPTVCSDVCGD